MELKGIKPGRFSPSCTKCRGKFELIIDNAAAEPKVLVAAERSMAVSSAVGAAARTMGSAPSAVATLAPGAGPANPPLGLDAPPQDLPPAGVNVTQVTTPPPSTAVALTGQVGGYEILKLLGEGGMGSVYLARQVSLDRNVAVKTLADTLAADPEFVARFTREAYAAAQLTHHNIVQIHELGEARRVHFFSMEFVEGQTLASTIAGGKRLEPDVAASYVLQAARGLKFAHDHGMIHRDIKPENLLLNDQGVVKVADLGLVKRLKEQETRAPVSSGRLQSASDASATQLNVSMGTPAYMAPEQARDAASVDARADIYSLGCTLYALVTGHPPFTGQTIIDIITKHATAPVTPPDLVVDTVGPMLSGIVMRMVAKDPTDRYQNMGAVITALEEYLGVSTAGPYRPGEEASRVVEFASQRFCQSGWGGLRAKLIPAFYALCLLVGLTCFLVVPDPLWRDKLALGMVAMGLSAIIGYQLTLGLSEKTFIFRKFRELVFGSDLVQWLQYIVVLLLGVTLLHQFDLLLTGSAFGIVGACIGGAFHLLIDKLATKDRLPSLRQVESLIRKLRHKGLEENAIREFISRYSGNNWEEFYEALFGYEAKMVARRMWGKNDRGIDRKKHAAWRDTVITWINRKLEYRRLAREQRYLARQEAKALTAKGIVEKVAKRQAMQNAERLVERASLMKRIAAKRAVQAAVAATTPPPAKPTAAPTAKAPQPSQMQTAAPVARQDVKTINKDWATNIDVAIEEDDELHDHRRRHGGYVGRRYGNPVDWIFGQKTRFALAAIVLIACGMWWNKNGREAAEMGAVSFIGKSVDPTVLAGRSEISSGKEQARDLAVARLGITFAEPESPGRVRSKGAQIAEVRVPSLANSSQLQEYDFITEIDGMLVEDPEQAIKILGTLSDVGKEEVEIEITRDREVIRLPLIVTIAEVPLSKILDEKGIGLLPDHIENAIGSHTGALVGLVLLISSLFSARMVGLCAYVATAIGVLGPSSILPVIGHPEQWMVSLAVAVVGLLGVFWFRTHTD